MIRHTLIAWAALLLSAHGSMSFGAPMVEGDAQVLSAIRDGLLTTEAHMRRGWMRFRAIELDGTRTRVVEGEYSWDDPREFFWGTMANLGVGTLQPSPDQLQPTERECLATETANLTYNKTDKVLQKDLHLRWRSATGLRTSPHRIGSHLSSTKYRTVADWLDPNETASRFSITALDKDRYEIERDILSDGTALRIVSDFTQGGQIISLSSRTEPKVNQCRSSATWVPDGNNGWRPASVSVLVYDVDPEKPHFGYLLTVYEYSHVPKHPLDKMGVHTIKPENGTYVIVTTPQGRQFSTVGQPAYDARKDFDQALRSAADLLKQQSGFGLPKEVLQENKP